MLKPSDVFTLQIPVSKTHIYAARGQAEAKFAKALDRGLVPVVFGEYGVGKTSLARVHFKTAEVRGRLVNIESAAGKSMSDIVAACLERVGFRVTTSRVVSAQETAKEVVGTKFGGGFDALKIELSGSTEKTLMGGQTFTENSVVTAPTDSRVLEVCEREGVALMIDELHQASEQMRDDLASFLKAYSNKGCKNFKIALLGTSSDATTIVKRDPGIDRVLQEVKLGAMTDAEATEVVVRGMESLKIGVPADLVQRIVRTSVGSPTIVQFLCLEAAEAAFKRDPRVLTPDDIDAAMAEFVSTRAERLNTLYLAAIETTGEKRYRAQILRAMAESDDVYVTLEEIRVRVSKQLGEDVPRTALSGPLRSLKDEYGQVLKDVERPTEEGAVFNRTTFRDPSMKAFIRFKLQAG